MPITVTEMFPALVAVYQPGFSTYRVFATGGIPDARQWVFGAWDGALTFRTLPAGCVRIRPGLYSMKAARVRP